MRSSSQSRPVINFHWCIAHSRFHDIKYYVFWTGYFCTPARSLNTPRWVITRVLPGTDRGPFVMIVGALVTWAIYTQEQLLLWSSLIITGVVPGYKWPRWLRLQLSPRSTQIRHTRHGGTLFGGLGWVAEWEPLSPVMRASPSTCRVLTVDWQVRGLCRCLWYARGLCLCPCVTTPRGFTSHLTQEAENSFLGFILTNEETKKEHRASRKSQI